MSKLDKVAADVSLDVVGVLGRPLYVCTARKHDTTTFMHGHSVDVTSRSAVCGKEALSVRQVQQQAESTNL